MKNLITLNKVLYFLLYFVLFLYIGFIFIEEHINKKWLQFSFKEYKTTQIDGTVKWYSRFKKNFFYVIHTQDNEKILLKAKQRLNIFDEVNVLIETKYLDIYDAYENYLYNNFYVNKVGYILEVIEVKKNKKLLYRTFSSVFEEIKKIREYFVKVIDENLNSDVSKSISKRLSLGYKDLEVEDLKTYFQDAGVAHVLVVSGLHVGFVYLLIKFLLKFLPIFAIELKEILCLIFLFLYMLLTGCDVPVVRATLMISCFVISFLLKRKSSFYHTLATAAFILLLFNPRSIFSVSFQLSFLVCFGIFYFYNFFNTILFDFINKQKLFLKNTIRLFLVTTSAQIAVAALIIFYFNKFSIVSFISNLIVVPYTSVLLWCNFGCYFLNIVLKEYSAIFWKLLDFLIFLYFRIVKFFATLPFSSIYVSLDVFKVFLYYFLVLLLPIFIYYKMKKTMFSFLSVWILLFFLSCKANKGFEIIFFNVELGDSIFVKTEDNVKLLIDTPQNSHIANKNLKPYLKGLRKIDYLVITHPHYIHYGALEYIVENFNVKEVIIPNFFCDDFSYESLIEKIESKKIKLEIIDNKKLVKFKNGIVEIIKNKNEGNIDKYVLADKNSLIIKIYYKDRLIFLTNDAPANDIIKHIDHRQKILVLQIPQHGKYPVETYDILNHLKSLNNKALINIVSTDEVNFDVNKFNSVVFSTNRWGNIRIIFKYSLDKIRKIYFSGYETKVEI